MAILKRGASGGLLKSPAVGTSLMAAPTTECCCSLCWNFNNDVDFSDDFSSELAGWTTGGTGWSVDSGLLKQDATDYSSTYRRRFQFDFESDTQIVQEVTVVDYGAGAFFTRVGIYNALLTHIRGHLGASDYDYKIGSSIGSIAVTPTDGDVLKIVADLTGYEFADPLWDLDFDIEIFINATSRKTGSLTYSVNLNTASNCVIEHGVEVFTGYTAAHFDDYSLVVT